MEHEFCLAMPSMGMSVITPWVLAQEITRLRGSGMIFTFGGQWALERCGAVVGFGAFFVRKTYFLENFEAQVIWGHWHWNETQQSEEEATILHRRTLTSMARDRNALFICLVK